MRYLPKNQVGVQHCSMTHAFKLFWVHYIDFTGHSTRSEYWWWRLWNCIIGLGVLIGALAMTGGGITTLITHIVSKTPMPSGSIGTLVTELIIVICLWLAWLLAIMIPSWALQVRRYNDVGLKTSWSITLLIATIVFGLLIRVNDVFLLIGIGLGVLSFILELLPSNSMFQNKPIQHPEYQEHLALKRKINK